MSDSAIVEKSVESHDESMPACGVACLAAANLTAGTDGAISRSVIEAGRDHMRCPVGSPIPPNSRVRVPQGVSNSGKLLLVSSHADRRSITSGLTRPHARQRL